MNKKDIELLEEQYLIFFLPKDKFDKLKVPEHPVFWKDFDNYTKLSIFGTEN